MQSLNCDNHANARSKQKLKFTQEEDQKLIQLVNQYGENDWGTITLFMEGRNIRQCRERWKHYLSPDVSNAPWSDMEDALLQQKYIEYGPKWKKIAEFFPNRTYINIKNRFLFIKRHNERITTQIVEISTELAKRMLDRKKKCFTSYSQCTKDKKIDMNDKTKNDLFNKKENNLKNQVPTEIAEFKSIIPQIKSQTIEVEAFQDEFDDFLTESNILIENFDEYYY